MAQTDDWLDPIFLGLQDWGASRGKRGIEPIVAKQAIRKHMAEEQLQILRGFRRRDFADENIYKIAVIDRIATLQQRQPKGE